MKIYIDLFDKNTMVVLLACLATVLFGTVSCSSYSSPIEWHLAMNLNPEDGHIMDYCTGWHVDSFIGSEENAFYKDYKNKYVWKEPANYIAILRHHNGIADAVKVWKFKYWGLSLLQRFSDMNPGRRIETVGGHLEKYVLPNAPNMADDPIFSVDGDLAFNWGYSDNGCRIAVDGSHLSGKHVNDDNTHGLGNHFAINPLTCRIVGHAWRFEISNIQNCPRLSCNHLRVQGDDHGAGPQFKTGPAYGQYAIYISRHTTHFPHIGSRILLKTIIEDSL